MFWLLCLVGAGSLGEVVSASSIEADEKRDWDRMAVLLNEGREPEALQSLGDYLRRYPLHPRSIEARHKLGDMFFNRRQWSEAQTEYVKIIDSPLATSEGRARAAVRLGEIHHALGQIERAIIDWSAVERRFPGSPSAERAKLLRLGVKP